MPAYSCITTGPTSVSAGNGLPLACAAVLQPVPISCHFRGCKSATVQDCKWRYNKRATFHLYSKLSLDNSASFTPRTKNLCQKWKVKLIFGDAYRLSGAGIVECLEIVDVRCNLKQSQTRLTLTPVF